MAIKQVETMTWTVLTLKSGVKAENGAPAGCTQGGIIMQAELEHQTLQGSDLSGTPQHLMCHVDGAECELLARIMPTLENVCNDNGAVSIEETERRVSQSIHEAKHHLPCKSCRLANAARLSGTRLGQRERHVLLLAAPADAAESTLVCAMDEPRALKESKMRAARKLAKAGLVSTTHQRTRITRRHRRIHKPAWWDHERKCLVAYRKDLREEVEVPVVAVKLTPLGAAIRQQYESELLHGRAIRWDSRAAEFGASARRDPATLLAELRQEMRGFEGWRAGMIGFGAMLRHRRPTFWAASRRDKEHHEAALRVIKAMEVAIDYTT